MSYLIIPLENTDNSAVPSRIEEALRPSGSEPKVVVGNRSDQRKSTGSASASAKLFLRGVRESADAFGPLKSVAGGLCFILENCEVWPSSRVGYLRHSQAFQRTKANRQAIESLEPRVEALSASLCEPISEGDVKEENRRKELEQ